MLLLPFEEIRVAVSDLSIVNLIAVQVFTAKKLKTNALNIGAVIYGAQ